MAYAIGNAPAICTADAIGNTFAIFTADATGNTPAICTTDAIGNTFAIFTADATGNTPAICTEVAIGNAPVIWMAGATGNTPAICTADAMSNAPVICTADATGNTPATCTADSIGNVPAICMADTIGNAPVICTADAAGNKPAICTADATGTTPAIWTAGAIGMMEDRDSCPVCFENFIMPKLLPCKHTFCLRCLKDYCDQQKTVSNEKLTTTNKDSIMDKNQIICPLCRNICTIPKKGFQDLFTNYFVQISKPPKICEICVQKNISTYCTTCFKNKCKICFRQYDHRKKTSTKSEVTEDNRPNPRLPFHLMFVDGIRTEYICEPTKTFQLDVPPNDEGKRWVYSVIASRKGGAYVLPQTVPFVLKFGSNTDLLGKIRTPDPCTCIIELQNGDLLGIFRRSRLILRYNCGGWSHFAATLDYFPFALAELSDSKIVVCGPNAISSGDIKEDEIYGTVRMYSAGGDVLGKIEKKTKKVVFFHHT
ncbi:TRIM45 [Mytilus coruscus]|uniref:TRIM45 n=1 Tax=Mytilus coruscus TaxID=42192 RepID=A0A6J8AVZ7_MYTCO|nr:TRIM45 [Mytilus coruscus]